MLAQPPTSGDDGMAEAPSIRGRARRGGRARIGDVENLVSRWEDLTRVPMRTEALMSGQPVGRRHERATVSLRRLLQRAQPTVRELGSLHAALHALEERVQVDPP